MKTNIFRVLGSVSLGTVLFALPALASTASLVPAGEGNYLQFTPSTGATHYTLVNEAVCNGLTNYTSTTGAGNRDSFALDLSSIPDGAIISAIEITPCASRVSSGGTNPVMNVFYRWGGVNSSDSGSYSLTATTPATLGATTYSGLARVKSSSSTLDIGAVLTSGSKGVRLSRIASVITYSFLEAPTDLIGTATTSASSTPAISLSWTDNSSTETAFVVEGKVSTSSLWKVLATTTPNTISYLDFKLASTSGTYTHRVRAWNGTIYSGYSNIATTTIP